MINTTVIAIVILGALVMSPSTQAQDLSRYRDFQFGMGLPAVAKQTRMKISDAKLFHNRPAKIQELVWEALSFTHSSPQTESVKDIQFSFYNGELFRLVVMYNRERIEGMTAEDLIAAISEKYGTASQSTSEITLSSTQLYGDGEKLYSNQKEKIIAQWEDSQYSFNLFQSSNQSTFGLVAYSKRLNTEAQAAIAEAIRLDEVEGPQRETARKKKQDDDTRVQQEKARKVNKAPFRP
ncbi:MAG TPA: hypothetical protein PLK30_21200 [Blastocatellia bacterium]|nr:hypothetical protein [Blastocatellia bacterium]